MTATDQPTDLSGLTHGVWLTSLTSGGTTLLGAFHFSGDADDFARKARGHWSWRTFSISSGPITHPTPQDKEG